MAESFVDKLPMCRTLDRTTIVSIKKIFVFEVYRSEKTSCIFINDEDDVFAMGGNKNGCLGLGDNHSRSEPVAIVQLCKQHVKTIASGWEGHVLALTDSGKLFSWGYNESGQLGNGNSNNSRIPVQVTTQLQDKKVIQIACGFIHSMALSEDGEIFAWGHNGWGQLGSGSTASQSTPSKVSLGKAATISCGGAHSVAVLDTGEVYGWGWNDSGELGLGHTDDQTSPCKVEGLSAVVVKQVVCGPAHTLALSDDGCVYSWGQNNSGQLGTQDRTTRLCPYKVNMEERFIEIAACHYSDMSAGLTQTGKVFQWGYCAGQQDITSPRLTELSTTDEVFVQSSFYRLTWRMYSADRPTVELNPGPVAAVWPNVDANPLDVNVRKCGDDDLAMKELFNNATEVYSMNDRTTGVRVLIINNKTFEGNTRDTDKPLDELDRTDIDAKALGLLFTQLGYKLVNTETDLTGQGIILALKNEARKCQTTDNAFICVILSHGTIGSVYGVDGQPVKLLDICDQLNGQKCPNLVGKPKLFFIQACQGNKKDAAGGVAKTDSAVELSKELKSLRIEKEQTDDAVVYPTMADILISTATTEGYVSWRNANKGSWFIQALVHVIQNYAYKYDLQKILTKTNDLIGNQVTKTSGYKQSSEKRDTFRKQFYFFPGFGEQDWSILDANPLDVNVRKCGNHDLAMKKLFNNTTDVYSMKGRTTGVRVLIINNKNFEGKTQDTDARQDSRPGTDIDAKCLHILFTEMGYKFVKTATNLTGQGIELQLKEEAQNCQATDNAFICVIMSHGMSGSVYGVDGQLVQLQDIYDQFNGQNCPNLAGKPKLFFIQACQGEKKDTTDEDCTMESDNDMAGLRTEQEQAAASAAAVPTMADILVSTATTEGYVSWRHPEKGSWYIQALVHVIQNYAYQCDLLQILTKTNKLITDQATSGIVGYKQCSEKRDTFRKQFYFFPGFEQE